LLKQLLTLVILCLVVSETVIAATFVATVAVSLTTTSSTCGVTLLRVHDSFPPSPLLVGVEPNPGPPKKVKIVVQKKKKQPKKGKALMTIRGHGDYSIGQQIGSSLGGMAESVIGKLFGSGSYMLGSNTLQSNAVPEFALSHKGNEFAHREFVADIFSGPAFDGSGTATAFNNRQFVINPADEALFPWIQQLAENYEVYEFLGLIFEFIPSSGNAVSSTNAALGTVIMATQYNSLDAPFTTKRQMESYEFATSTVPSKAMIHPVECARGENALETLYINNPGAQTNIGDPRFANLGILNIATIGQQALKANLGELWVSAHVRFKRPRLAPATYMFKATATGGPGANATISNGPFLVDSANSTISGVSVVNTTAGQCVVSFPLGYRGQWLLTAASNIGGFWNGLNNPFNITAVTGGLSSVNLINNNTTSSADTVTVASGDNVTKYTGLIAFQSDGTAGTISFGKGGANPNGSLVVTDLFIAPFGQAESI